MPVKTRTFGSLFRFWSSTPWARVEVSAGRSAIDRSSRLLATGLLSRHCFVRDKSLTFRWQGRSPSTGRSVLTSPGRINSVSADPMVCAAGRANAGRWLGEPCRCCSFCRRNVTLPICPDLHLCQWLIQKKARS
jgi:hypothetical protein